MLWLSELKQGYSWSLSHYFLELRDGGKQWLVMEIYVHVCVCHRSHRVSARLRTVRTSWQDNDRIFKMISFPLRLSFRTKKEPGSPDRGSNLRFFRFNFPMSGARWEGKWAQVARLACDTQEGKPCNQQQRKPASMVMDGVTCPPSVCALSAVHAEVMARLILSSSRDRL